MSDDKIVKLDKDKVEKLRKDNEKNTNPNRTMGFDVDKNDNIKSSSVKNATLLIQKTPNLNNIFKFNEFTQEIDVTKDVELKTSLGNPKIKKGAVTDNVINSLELFFEDKNQVAFKNALIDQAISNIAHLNSYNPAKDYLLKCYSHWDKKRRLDNFFPTYLGVEKTDTNILIARLFFKGVVAKILTPMIKFDFVLDMVGGQGVGKTSCFQKIAPCGYYTDQFNSFTDKDDFQVMKNAVIVNDDEMTASNKASFEEVKKFITMQKFEFRRAYARKAETFTKKFVLVRTTNERYHLKDRSGDRRFISLWCDAERQEKSPIKDLTQDEIDQLWGEAMYIYDISKDPFLLSPKEKAMLARNREEFMYTSGLENSLRDVLDNNFSDKNFITNRELSNALFHDPDALSHNSKETRDVRYYMEHLGYDVGVMRKINGLVKRGFEKK